MATLMPPPSTPSARGGSPFVTVLFVDDEPALLRGIARMLRDAPLEVLTAGNAEEALAALRERDVDVLISDIDMPGMSGLELVKVVRREFPSVLRMLFSGAGTMDRAMEAINEGEVHRFFTKPFGLELFQATMAAMADRIDALRRDGEKRAQDTRREELYRWVEQVFPGTLDIARNAEGEIVIEGPFVEIPLREGPRSGR
jgi:DNA-binding NtrC family response regulator